MGKKALWKTTVIAAAAAAMAVSVCGCDKKKDPAKSDTAAVAAKDKKDKGDKGDSAKGDTTVAGDYKAGDVAKFMPADCPDGRIYVNISGLVSDSSSLAKLQEKFVASAEGKDGEKAKEVLKVFKDGGFDPASGIKEIAICMNEKEKMPIVALGLMLDKVKDPLGLISKAVEAGGEKAPKKEKEGDVEYLSGLGKKNTGVVAKVSPSVLLMAKDKGAAVELAKSKDVAAGFTDASKHVIFASVKMGPDGVVDVKVTDAGDKYKIEVTLPSNDKDMTTKPEEAAKAMEGEAAKLAEKLQKTPFKMLAEYVKAAKFTIADGKMTVTAEVPKKALSEATKAASEADPKELMKDMDLH